MLVRNQRLTHESILAKLLHKMRRGRKVETNVKKKFTLAIVKFYNFTVLGFNSSYRTNEITM